MTDYLNPMAYAGHAGGLEAPETEGSPSFDHLPLELRLKCLASCDWQTLSRASCASRGTRALVAYLVRAPYWRTYSEEQPAVLTTEFAKPEECSAACSQWAAGLVASLCSWGKPDICFVFASSQSHDNLPALLCALRGNLPACTLLAGVIAPGVLGRTTGCASGLEVEGTERAGLVVSVLHLPPGSQVHAVLATEGLAPERNNPDWRPPEGELPAGPGLHPRTWVLLSDRHAHMEGALRELEQRYPGERVCGGMGGGTDGAPSLIVGLPGRLPGDAAYAAITSGTLLLSFSGPGVEAEPITARGMRCISQRFMVSQVSANVDLSPVGRVTLVQQLQNSIGLATGTGSLTWVPVGSGFTPTSALVAALQAQGADVAPRAPLFFGVRAPGGGLADDDPCRMVMLQMHDPNNLMRTSGYVSIQYPVQRGMLAAFYTPEPRLSRQQLRERLLDTARRVGGRGQHASAAAAGASSRDTTAEEDLLHTVGGLRSTKLGLSAKLLPSVLSADPAPVLGCLLFPCVAKGRRYYNEPGVESSLLQATFPGSALCGFFCNGEIGPTPPDELGLGEVPETRMMGYSTVACVLKLSAAPSPPAEWFG